MDYDVSRPSRDDADVLSYAAGHKAMGLYAMWALRNEVLRVAAPEQNVEVRVFGIATIEAQGYDKIRSVVEVDLVDGRTLVQPSDDRYRGGPERPRCRQAFSMTIRPRGVRAMKPCCNK